MRICSWNIWSKGSELTPRHWLACADELSGLDLDLVALQEVDCYWGARSDHAHVSKDMASQMGFHLFFCPSIIDGNRRYGNAILSRFPVLQSGRVELSPEVAWDKLNHETEPRTAAWVRVEEPQPLVLVNVHLANAIGFASTRITMTQAERLAVLLTELAGLFPDSRLVLCGDFNLEPSAPEIALLESILPRRSDSTPTWPVHPFNYKGWTETPPPRFTVDHFFSSSPMRAWVGESSLSDHLPLIAEG